MKILVPTVPTQKSLETLGLKIATRFFSYDLPLAIIISFPASFFSHIVHVQIAPVLIAIIQGILEVVDEIASLFQANTDTDQTIV